MTLSARKILVMTSVYPRFPEDRYGCFIQEFILHLQETEARFRVFAPAYKGSPHQQLAGIPVYRFRYGWKFLEILTHGEGQGVEASRASTKVQKNPFYLLLAASYIVCGAWQLFWVCRQDKPDLLHVHWPFPHGLMAWPTSILLNIPMVFSCYGAELLLGRNFGFVRPILRGLFPQSRRVTAISSFTKGLIEELYDGPVTVIPYGITLEIRSSSELPTGELPRLLCVGNMYERKGMRYLIEALPLVLAQVPVQLRIVGKGEQEEALKAQVKNLGIEQSVAFLGFVSNETLALEYATCDIFILPSIVDSQGDTEGQGIPVVEALAHGKPVVASAVGGIVDAIESGVTGILVPEKNPQALAQAILSLLTDPEQAKQMGRRGQEDIRDRFSWTRMSQKWEKVFTEALGLS